jgi:D-amino-acid dehydrogenase
MRVCIVGAGVIGVTTAHALAKRGHDVVVADAASAPGLGTSHANGGQLSYAYVAPLADASIWKNMPKYLFANDSPLTWRPSLDAAQWSWLARFLRACNGRASARTTGHLLNLAFYSRDCLEALLKELALDFDFRTAGKLVMLSSKDALNNAARQVRLQSRLGCEQSVLDVDECVAVEPALAASRHRWLGGVYTPSEQVGDCGRFCEELARQSKSRYGNLRFEYGACVTDAIIRGGKVAAVRTSAGEIDADVFILANGAAAGRVASRMGFDLPIYPLKGYSVTFQVPPGGDAVPMVSVTDLAKKIVYARLGSRLRVAGRLEIVGHDLRVSEEKTRSLAAEACRLFPALNPREAAFPGWSGLRPATPSGIPVVGKGPLSNLYLNTGHGALGWTLACGSAELLARRIGGEPTQIDDRPFSYQD